MEKLRCLQFSSLKKGHILVIYVISKEQIKSTLNDISIECMGKVNLKKFSRNQNGIVICVNSSHITKVTGHSNPNIQPWTFLAPDFSTLNPSTPDPWSVKFLYKKENTIKAGTIMPRHIWGYKVAGLKPRTSQP